MSEQYGSNQDQLELFLKKFESYGIKRKSVEELLKQFISFDADNSGVLEENEALQLLEKRNETRTFKELRELVADIDKDKNRKLCFLEWAVAIFNVEWAKLWQDPEADKAAIQAEMDKLEKSNLSAEEKKKAIAKLHKSLEEQEKKILAERAEAARRKKEAEEAERKQIEYEKTLTGVKGAKAFFSRQIKNDAKGANSTLSNEEQVKLAAKQRREDRERKRKAKEAKIKAEEEAKKAEEEAEKQKKIAAEAEVKAKEEAKKKEQAEYEERKRKAEEEERKKKEAEEEARRKKRAALKARAAMWEKK